MNISLILAKFNKGGEMALSDSYYKHIANWRAWWSGFNKDFHEYTERNNGVNTTRRLYALRMAKKVCEDWASLLLNEKTLVSVASEQAQTYLDKVFADTDFWQEGNQIVEKAFAFGTGAVILRFGDIANKGDLSLQYLPADNVIPLTVKGGKVVDCAFASESIERGKTFVYLETHTLEKGGYVIKNEYFESTGGSLVPATLPEGIAEEIKTSSEIPLFTLIKPNIVNNMDEATGLGISVFANAVDQLMGVDLAYNNFNRDLKLGGKKVFYNTTMVDTDENGKKIAPDDVAQQLFHVIGDALIEGKSMIYEYNPDLRTAANAEAVQAQLDYLSFKTGLGMKHYQFNAGSIVTATQYMGDKQELVQNASKHYINIEQAITDIVKAILWAGDFDPEMEITVTFDDSVIIDKESERLRDMNEVLNGLMSKIEFRMKWYGDTEEEAQKAIDDMKAEMTPPAGEDEDEEGGDEFGGATKPFGGA